jgi:hypothetical protein
MLVGAVRHLVHDRLRVRPEPRERPEQPAERERQQAERADRLELRMMSFVRDLLGKDVDHPEQDDQHNRYDEDHEQGKKRGELVLGLGREERGARLLGSGQNQDEQADDHPDCRSERRRRGSGRAFEDHTRTLRQRGPATERIWGTQTLSDISTRCAMKAAPC